MTTQVINAFFHIFFSFYFLDFSPGAITGILLYLPVNYLIFQSALKESLIKNYKEVVYLFILGASSFALFELFGPKIMLVALIFSIFYYLIASKREALTYN
jgi:hypothetical protein